MKKKFSWRMFTSFALFMSLFLLFVSGVILYIFPEAGPSGFIREFAGLTKPVWLNQHIIFGIAFVLFSCYHLFFINRDTFFSYLKKKSASAGLPGRAELAATMVVIVCIALGTYHSQHPFSGSFNSGGEISGSSQGEERELADSDDQRAAYPDRSRHQDFEEHHDRGGAWLHRGELQQTSLREDTGAAGEIALDYRQDNNDAGASAGQAPDDDLHRRTTASCASCH
ncbi:MAG: DUF4405 domain-containing protein [Chlorobiaceae bacterium]|jgi:hypothetical protein|nr:DUF4405 domain-containing protein [Chlorobiaceae bacterium]